MENQKKASDSDKAGAIVYLMEELGDARMRAEELKRLVDRAQKLVDESENRDKLYEIAGDVITTIPGTLFLLLQAVRAAAFAASKMDYEILKAQLSPTKNDQLEEVLTDVRVQTRMKSSRTETLVSGLRKLATDLESGKVKGRRVVQNIWELVNDKFTMSGGFYYPVVEFDETANTRTVMASKEGGTMDLLLTSVKALSDMEGGNPREGLITLSAYLGATGSEDASHLVYQAAMTFPEKDSLGVFRVA